MVTLSAILGCQAVQGASETETRIAGTGTIVFNNFEGGFWGILGDDGKRYDPGHLDKSFQVSGLKVRFEAGLRKDVVGFHMWGTPIELIRIEKLE